MSYFEAFYFFILPFIFVITPLLLNTVPPLLFALDSVVPATATASPATAAFSTRGRAYIMRRSRFLASPGSRHVRLAAAYGPGRVCVERVPCSAANLVPVIGASCTTIARLASHRSVFNRWSAVVACTRRVSESTCVQLDKKILEIHDGSLILLRDAFY